jgi:hypothetical protein
MSHAIHHYGLTAPQSPDDPWGLRAHLPCLRSRLFRFEGRWLDPGSVPAYFGQTLRGGLGFALQDLLCIRSDRTCDGCLVGQDCAFVRLFAPRPMPGTPFMKTYDKIPQPLVIRPIGTGGRFDAGDDLAWDFLLIGQAVVSLPTCILAFARLGARGVGFRQARFRLVCVRDLDDGIEVFREAGRVSLGAPLPFAPGPPRECREIAVHIATPLRIREGGRPAQNLPFHLLVRNLLRRASMIAAFHSGSEFPVDFSSILEAARAVETLRESLSYLPVQRFSTRQKQTQDLGGLVGVVHYRGALGPFLPLLEFGVRFHIGKATSFGLGCIGLRQM